jgi:hypothetical protein
MLSNIMPHIISEKINKLIFMFFLIQFFANKIKAKIIPIIAALDRVIIIANIRKAIKNKLIFWKGFTKIFFNFLKPLPRHKSIHGKNAIRKYP